MAQLGLNREFQTKMGYIVRYVSRQNKKQKREERGLRERGEGGIAGQRHRENERERQREKDRGRKRERDRKRNLFLSTTQHHVFHKQQEEME